MIQDMIFNSAGGLALFVYGMGLLSDGLKKAAGEKLRQILEVMTRKPLMGFTMGMVATALVQSSSASTVMVIGLVNAGLMTLRQAICVIFGTNVGTTATAWIVSLTGLNFKLSTYTLAIIAVGMLCEMLGKTRRAKSLGQILIGFGILFVGIEFMEGAFMILRDSEGVRTWLTGLGGKPMLALLAGAMLTMLIQSSSASIMIVQTLAYTGAFALSDSDEVWTNAVNVAIPFVLGCNIGTTITAQIASLRTNLASRRTAWAHTMFNVLGSAIALPFVYLGLFGTLVHIVAPWQLSKETIMPTIAVAHTLFNVINSVLFLPFAGLLEKIVVHLVRPRRGEIVERAVVLETHLLDTPVLALQQAKREMIRMGRQAKLAVQNACEGITENDVRKLEAARRIEDVVDDYQNQITSYLVNLSQRQLSDEVSTELPVLLHMVNDLERVGDHAVNIVEIAERKIEQKLAFSDEGIGDSARMVQETYTMFDNVLAALDKNSVQSAHAALANENAINRMQLDFRRSHVCRMTDGVCGAPAGLIFIDLVDNLEKIGDHLTNVAQSVIGGLHWEGLDASAMSGEYRALNDKDA
ncbi:MAG: Na/Pi cotransporter family protein [Phycisphaerae bacterium]|nr:Na/Pi cotransporter family protein [Phycisphaerae bacterium]